MSVLFTLHLGENQKKVHVPPPATDLQVERWLSLALMLPPAIPQAASSALEDEPQGMGLPPTALSVHRISALRTSHCHYLSVTSAVSWLGRGCREAEALASESCLSGA